MVLVVVFAIIVVVSCEEKRTLDFLGFVFVWFGFREFESRCCYYRCATQCGLCPLREGLINSTVIDGVDSVCSL